MDAVQDFAVRATLGGGVVDALLLCHARHCRLAVDVLRGLLWLDVEGAGDVLQVPRGLLHQLLRQLCVLLLGLVPKHALHVCLV